MGVTGKSLGGVFSSLARQRIDGQFLVLPYGQGEGRGLRWKLNERVVTRKNLKSIVEEILATW